MSASAGRAALEAVDFHGRLAGDWESRYSKNSFRSRPRVLAECLQDLDLRGSRWLDAGCGTGTLSRWLAQRGCHVLGVDASKAMVEKAKEFANSQPNSEPQFMHIETIAHLPLEDASVDGVLCSSVLEYVEDPDACLADFARILKPEGLLLVSVPNRQSLIRKAQLGLHHVGAQFGQSWFPFVQHSRHQYSREEFVRLLSDNGFIVEKALAFGSPLPRSIQRLRFAGSLLMLMARKSVAHQA